MKRFVELNALEMMSALAALAGPLGNLAEDDELWECFQECIEKRLTLKKSERLRFGLKSYAKIAPLLLSKEHIQDTLTVASIIEGKPVKEMGEVLGSDFIFDLMEAWKKELLNFFIKCGILVRKE